MDLSDAASGDSFSDYLECWGCFGAYSVYSATRSDVLGLGAAVFVFVLTERSMADTPRTDLCLGQSVCGAVSKTCAWLALGSQGNELWDLQRSRRGIRADLGGCHKEDEPWHET